MPLFSEFVLTLKPDYCYCKVGGQHHPFGISTPNSAFQLCSICATLCRYFKNLCLPQRYKHRDFQRSSEKYSRYKLGDLRYSDILRKTVKSWLAAIFSCPSSYISFSRVCTLKYSIRHLYVYISSSPTLKFLTWVKLGSATPFWILNTNFSF